jgi:REP element-mobilizing transposase RayT
MIPKGWHSRGYLPHFDSPETIQFITFRLADSLPHHVAQALKATNEYALALDRELDGNLGECWLAQPKIAALVQEALLHFDGERYRLLAWCLMPNHAHVVVEAVDSHSLSEVVRGWKSFSARRANGLLGRTGPFWHPDYFDRYMRNEEHLHRTIEYVEQNPVKAGLTKTAGDWPWSSAAFRTAAGHMSGPGGPRSQKTDS